MPEKLCSLCIRIIEILSIFLFVLLAAASFLKTAFIKSAYDIPILLTWDNPLLNLLFLAVFLFVLAGAAHFIVSFRHGRQVLLFFVCLWVFLGSLTWTYFSKSGPASDCGSVYYAAKQFARNDFSALAYRGSYFSCYPFQLGLAFFYEIIFRIVRNDNFHILQGVNAVCLVICVFSQYHLTSFFFSGDYEEKTVSRIQVYELLLTASCLPFIMYGSYIYGEIPSFAFLLSGSLLLLVFLNTKNIFSGIFGFTAIVLSVMVRKNTLIFLIALGILLFLYLFGIRQKFSARWKVFLLLYFVFMFFCSVEIIPAVQHGYAVRSGTEINAGVPVSDYLAMGMMEADSGPGGYSGYNFDTFTAAANYDSQKASSIGWSAYSERLDYFSQNPSYAADFLGTKFLEQWLNAGWSIFDSTYVAFGKRLPLIEACFSGSLYPVFIEYMSNYQMVLYLLTALSCFLLFRKHVSALHDTRIFRYLFLLTAVGGAIFYLIWEASGRYVLPYSVFLFPNAAAGMLVLENAGKKILSRGKS